MNTILEKLNEKRRGRVGDEIHILQVGSRVRVTSYGPFRELRGTIRTVDTIPADLKEPFCFYLVALDETYSKEPIWFDYREVDPMTSLIPTLQ